VWVAWTLLVIAWTPLVAIAWAQNFGRDPARKRVSRLFHRCAAVATRLNPFWRFRIAGDPPPEASHPFVVVCNHESLADVMLVGGTPWEMKWLSKASVFRLPFIGWMMRMAGDVAVHRGDPDSRGTAFEQLRQRLESGSSVMIFPEGTRSQTPDLLPFRNGAFRLAIETGTPVLPLALSGTRSTLERGSLLFQPADVVLRILEPVKVTGLTTADTEALRDRVREMIAAARD